MTIAGKSREREEALCIILERKQLQQRRRCVGVAFHGTAAEPRGTREGFGETGAVISKGRFGLGSELDSAQCAAVRCGTSYGVTRQATCSLVNGRRGYRYLDRIDLDKHAGRSAIRHSGDEGLEARY